MEKSYVTMAVCPICGEDTGALLLDKKLEERFEMRTVTPQPCDACREKYLSEGVLLFAPNTGGVVVLKDEAFERIFDQKVPVGKIAFCDAEVIDILISKEPKSEGESE